MTTELRLSAGAPALPTPPRRGPREAAVGRGGRRLSVVWLVPLVAAAIAAWLAVTTLREQGPTVSIAFKTAEGLEAGKTKVRYKDIDVGTVQDLRLSDDLENVVAVAELRKQAEPFAAEGTRWWVVRPRVGASGVSGLGTLISGAYIGLDPGRGERTLSFTGLEEPPPMTSDVPGRRFALHADGKEMSTTMAFVRVLAASYSSRTSVTTPTGMPLNWTGLPAWRPPTEPSNRTRNGTFSVMTGSSTLRRLSNRRNPRSAAASSPGASMPGVSNATPPARIVCSDSVATSTPPELTETSMPLAFQNRLVSRTSWSCGASTKTSKVKLRRSSSRVRPSTWPTRRPR